MTATPDQTKIIAGGSFLKVNGTNGYGLVALDATDRGAQDLADQPGRPRLRRQTAAILSLTADKDTVYGSGYAFGGTKGYFEGAFAARPSDGKVKWLQDCHGDTYSAAPVGDVVYSVGHAHDCSNIGGFPDPEPRRLPPRAGRDEGGGRNGGQERRRSGAVRQLRGPARPALYNWFPDLTTGTYTGLNQAAWSVIGTDQLSGDGR